VYPPDAGSPAAPAYAGTFATLYGTPLSINRTLQVYCPDWRDPSNQDNMDLYAEELHGSVSDVVYEGECQFVGLLEAALTPLLALNVAGDTYTTGWESVELPVVSCEVEFRDAGPLPYVTSLHASNRRAALTAAPYLRPPMVGMDLSNGYGVIGGGGIHFAGPDFTAPFAGAYAQMQQMAGVGGQGMLGAASGMTGAINDAIGQGLAGFLGAIPW
jgi:hypothetical protein